MDDDSLEYARLARADDSIRVLYQSDGVDLYSLPPGSIYPEVVDVGRPARAPTAIYCTLTAVTFMLYWVIRIMSSKLSQYTRGTIAYIYMSSSISPSSDLPVWLTDEN